MLEYGIKAITTNPTLITKANEIIRLVDSRTKNTRAFVLPASYAPYVEKIIKEMEYKKWVKEKKAKLAGKKTEDDSLAPFEAAGIQSVEEYLNA